LPKAHNTSSCRFQIFTWSRPRSEWRAHYRGVGPQSSSASRLAIRRLSLRPSCTMQEDIQRSFKRQSTCSKPPPKPSCPLEALRSEVTIAMPAGTLLSSTLVRHCETTLI
jgi:hypothetical protein